MCKETTGVFDAVRILAWHTSTDYEIGAHTLHHAGLSKLDFKIDTLKYYFVQTQVVL